MKLTIKQSIFLSTVLFVFLINSCTSSKSPSSPSGGGTVATATPAGDAFEIDNSPAQAKRLYPGTPQNKTAHTCDNDDWVYFVVPTQSDISFQVTGTTYPIYIEAWDGSNTQTANGAFFAGDGASTSITVPVTGMAPGTYYANVRPWNYASPGCDVFPYTLSLSIVSLETVTLTPTITGFESTATITPTGQNTQQGTHTITATVTSTQIIVPSATITQSATPALDAYEPDDTYLQADETTGDEAGHTINPPGEQDWYKFTVPANQGMSLTMNVTITSPTDNSHLYFYDASGAALDSYLQDYYGSPNPQFTRVLSTGTYYVKFVYEGLDSVSYDVVITKNMFTPTSTITMTPTATMPPALDAYEPDDDPLSANVAVLTPGATQVRSIYPAGDRDIMKFIVTYPSIVTVDVSSVGMSEFYNIYFHEDSTLTGGGLDFYGGAPPGQIKYDFSVPGTYYLRIESYPGQEYSRYRMDFAMLAMTPTVTQSMTYTQTVTPTITLTHTASQTYTDSPTISATPTMTPTFTVSETYTITQTHTVSPTITVTATITQTPTPGWRGPFNFTSLVGMLAASCTDTYAAYGTFMGVSVYDIMSGELVAFGGLNTSYIGKKWFASRGTDKYIAYKDRQAGSPTENNVVVKKHNSFSLGWDLVGGTSAYTPDDADGIELFVDQTNGQIYTAYMTYTSGKAEVMKFNGTSWASLGNNFTPLVGSDVALTGYNSAGDTKLYFAYFDYADPTGNSRLAMAYHDGTSWSNLGGYISNGGSSGVDVVCDKITGEVYVAFTDSDNKAYVKKYAGSWQTVGGTAVSDLAYYPTLYLKDDGSLLLAYSDHDAFSNKATVKTFEGVSWNLLGSPKFTPAAVSEMGLAVNGGIPMLISIQPGFYKMWYQ